MHKLLSEIAKRGDKVNEGLTCGTREALAEAATLSLVTLHYDGGDLSVDTLEKVVEIAKGH